MFSLYLPIYTVSEANERGSWRWGHKRSKAQRAAVHNLWPRRRDALAAIPAPPWVVTLVRLAPGTLDVPDNLSRALKAIRDQVADELGLPSDADPRVTWRYEQEKVSRAARGTYRNVNYGVRIEITGVEQR